VSSNSRIAYINAMARRLGLDPKAVDAVGSMEGFSGRIGDGGHAFGPFQENNAGGVLTGRFPGASTQQLNQWAWSNPGIMDALSRMARVAKGERGAQAIQDIVGRFERPANPSAEIAGAERRYGGSLGPLRASGPSGPLDVLHAVTGGSGGSSGSSLDKQLLGEFFLQQAQDALSGKQDGSGILGLALARKALGANGIGTLTTPPSTDGKGGMGPIRPPKGGKADYSNISFDPNVDWQHVNPSLLDRINQVAAAHGVTVTINSGYRSNAKSRAVGGFPGDPHTKGLAVDAYVNGKPIGQVIPASVWAKFGITSGDVPNFYNGAPDPEHLQLSA